MSATATGSMTCMLCGHAFDPSANGACESCPLHNGCHLVCCPACGHSTVDPGASVTARLTARLRRRRPDRTETATTAPGCVSLAEVAPGGEACVSTLDALESRWSEHLQAYGLAPGRWVRVVQHAPLTVIRVDHTDVALESRLARAILVEPAS